jgi:hypothetical protein
LSSSLFSSSPCVSESCCSAEAGDLSGIIPLIGAIGRGCGAQPRRYYAHDHRQLIVAITGPPASKLAKGPGGRTAPLYILMSNGTPSGKT